MELDERAKAMLCSGIEVQALFPKVHSRSFYNPKRKNEFSLYYVCIRIRGNNDFNHSVSLDEDNSFILDVQEQEYAAAAAKCSAVERKEPCKITYFKTEADAQQFINDYIYPKLLGIKLKYFDKDTINTLTYSSSK